MSACLRGMLSCCRYGNKNLVYSLRNTHLLARFQQPCMHKVSKHFSTSHQNQLLRKKLNENLDEQSGQPFLHPDKGELVYSGTLTKGIKRLKRLSIFSSCLGVMAIPLFLQKGIPLVAIGGFSFFIFITPLLIHFVFAKKYVTDIYYNSETKKFSMAKLSFLLFRKEFEYTANDVVIPDIPGAFATYKIQGKPVFINRDMFTSKEAYKHMVGYDKPLDLNMYDKARDEQAKSESKTKES